MLSKIVSDFQVRFDRSDQRGLRSVLGLQGTEDLLINGVGYRQMLDDDRLGGLALPPQPCDGLLVKLKAPCQPKPHEAVAACLQVESVSGRGWVDQRHWQLTGIPSADTLGGVQLGKRDMPRMEPPHDPLQIVLEPVGH